MSTKPRKTRPTILATPNPDYSIFVSHSSMDKWIARVICEKLEAVGATTFRDDRDIDGGDDIPERLRSKIRRSREMVVLMTPRSVGSEWVRLEIGAAWGCRKSFRIVAVLYHVEVDMIPSMLKSKKAIVSNDFDDYVAEVAERVRRFSS